MNSLISVQTLIEHIEALPAQEQTLLFDELFRRKIIKQRQEQIALQVNSAIDLQTETVIEKVIKSLQAILDSVKLTSSRSNNPWVSLAGKYENDPQYDEVLAHIEESRRELDAETEAYYSQIDAAVETQ